MTAIIIIYEWKFISRWHNDDNIPHHIKYRQKIVVDNLNTFSNIRKEIYWDTFYLNKYLKRNLFFFFLFPFYENELMKNKNYLLVNIKYDFVSLL